MSLSTGIGERARDRGLRLPAWRLARVVVLALVIGLGINHLWWSIVDWHLDDMDAYWNAGLRLRDGAALYPPVSDVLASEVYRYSPWFAWLWVPLTILPRTVVDVAWSAALLGASVVAVIPMARRGSWIAAAFFFPILVGISAGGNVHALLIAGLVHGVERRSGPAWIGIAASLKAFPILLALSYAGRGEWRRAALAVGVTAVLLAPYLLYDLSNYVTTAGGAAMLSQWPVAYAAAAVAAAVVALRLARSRFAWLASSVAVAVALPRFFLYDVTYLAVAFAEPERRPRSSDISAGARPTIR